MPVEISEQNGGKLLVVHATGKLAKEDYDKFGPEVDRTIKQFGKVNVLFDMTGFHGWEVGAIWQDIKFDAKHFKDINRLAIVGEKKWQEWMAGVCRPFTSANIKYFDHGALDEALAWAKQEGAA